MLEALLEPETRRRIAPFRRALRRASADLSRPLPWIGVGDPWGVFVSEVMLQQTSTARVIEPWRRFLATYPSPTSLAEAPLADVLRHWSGLGYPRRAKSLQEAARVIVDRFEGEVPSRVQELLTLPGVGPYTARAVASFAFTRRVAVVDTNVGRVLSRALANRPLSPREAQALADALMPRERVAEFNQAMLDLGAQMCTSRPLCEICPVAGQCRWRDSHGPDPAPRSAGVSRPQGRFVGSDRQIRGRILRSLSGGPLSASALRALLTDVVPDRLDSLVNDLCREGFLDRRGARVCLRGETNAPGKVSS